MLLPLRKSLSLMHICFINILQLILKKNAKNLFIESFKLSVMFGPVKMLFCPTFEAGSFLLQVCIISGHTNDKEISEKCVSHTD